MSESREMKPSRDYLLKIVENNRLQTKRNRARHPDTIRAQKRRYRARHPDTIREQKRRYHARHPDTIREQKRRYRARHPDTIREQKRRYRTRPSNTIREKRREAYQRFQEKRKQKKRTQCKVKALGFKQLTVVLTDCLKTPPPPTENLLDYLESFCSSLSPEPSLTPFQQLMGSVCRNLNP